MLDLFTTAMSSRAQDVLALQACVVLSALAALAHLSKRVWP